MTLYAGITLLVVALCGGACTCVAYQTRRCNYKKVRCNRRFSYAGGEYTWLRVICACSYFFSLAWIRLTMAHMRDSWTFRWFYVVFYPLCNKRTSYRAKTIRTSCKICTHHDSFMLVSIRKLCISICYACLGKRRRTRTQCGCAACTSVTLSCVQCAA